MLSFFSQLGNCVFVSGMAGGAYLYREEREAGLIQENQKDFPHEARICSWDYNLHAMKSRVENSVRDSWATSRLASSEIEYVHGIIISYGRISQGATFFPPLIQFRPDLRSSIRYILGLVGITILSRV